MLEEVAEDLGWYIHQKMEHALVLQQSDPCCEDGGLQDGENLEEEVHQRKCIELQNQAISYAKKTKLSVDESNTGCLFHYIL